MPIYSEGKIYKIHCNLTGEDYYGSTTYTLQVRINSHTSKCKKPLNRQCKSRQIIERGNFQIELVENYPCETKRELHVRERYYIDNFPNINHFVPTRTQKEYKETRKEFIKEYNTNWEKEHRQERNDIKKERYKTNEDYRQKGIERSSQYYQENKEKVLERLMCRYVCECGAEGLVANKSRHEKSKRHQKFITQTSS